MSDQLKPSTPIDELLERWRIETQRSSEDESLAWETFQQDKCREELSTAWTATKAQMVAREEAEALAEALWHCIPSTTSGGSIRDNATQALARYRFHHPKPQEKTT